MELVCPRDMQHGPHDDRALFCWICGKELVCEHCGLSAADHQAYKDGFCPLVRFPREPSLSS